MAILPVTIHPDPILREKAAKVDAITPEILQLLDDMVETMYDEDGIGLAAPQISVSLRIAVIDVEQREEGEKGVPYKLINPEIIARSETETVLNEGCLSLPEMRCDVSRPEQVTVRYMDEKGVTQEIVADGLLAKCLQHEIDHLDGIMIFDHVSKLKRDMLMRRYQKTLRSFEA